MTIPDLPLEIQFQILQGLDDHTLRHTATAVCKVWRNFALSEFTWYQRLPRELLMQVASKDSNEDWFLLGGPFMENVYYRSLVLSTKSGPPCPENIDYAVVKPCGDWHQRALQRQFAVTREEFKAIKEVFYDAISYHCSLERLEDDPDVGVFFQMLACHLPVIFEYLMHLTFPTDDLCSSRCPNPSMPCCPLLDINPALPDFVTTPRPSREPDIDMYDCQISDGGQWINAFSTWKGRASAVDANTIKRLVKRIVYDRLLRSIKRNMQDDKHYESYAPDWIKERYYTARSKFGWPKPEAKVRYEKLLVEACQICPFCIDDFRLETGSAGNCKAVGLKALVHHLCEKDLGEVIHWWTIEGSFEHYML